jgi:hypothetical protein
MVSFFENRQLLSELGRHIISFPCGRKKESRNNKRDGEKEGTN